MIAAELPDVDYVYRLGGPLLYFQHHRGWTHALWSLPLQAALITVFFFVLHGTRHKWKRHRSVDEPAPARWKLLWLMALLASCSHLLLDLTNNYGIRPLAPFYPHWFAGNLFFIVEPVLLLALCLALLLPLVFSLVNREMGIRRARYQGQGLAIAALVLMLGMAVQRIITRDDATDLAHAQLPNSGAVLRATVSPYPITSETWHGVIETRQDVQSGKLNMKLHTFEIDPSQIYTKRPDTPVITAAKSSWLGHVYLDWSTFAEVTDRGTAAQVHPGMTLSAADGAAHVIRFQDPRFLYNTMFMHDADVNPPLSAEAWVDDTLHVRRIYFGDARQKLPR